MSSIGKQFFINQLVWIGISFCISITISILIPFPISLVAILGIFLFLNFYLRRRMIAKYGNVQGTVMGGMYTAAADGGSLKYYCMNCGTQHKETSCPNCDSKMKTIGL